MAVAGVNVFLRLDAAVFASFLLFFKHWIYQPEWLNAKYSIYRKLSVQHQPGNNHHNGKWRGFGDHQ